MGNVIGITQVQERIARSKAGRRRIAKAVLAAALLGSTLSAAPTASPAVAAPGESSDPIVNPDLTRACGIDIHVILDESGSVRNYRGDVQTAFRAFTSSLRNTGSRLAVSEFSTTARLPLPGSASNSYTAVTDATINTIFEPYIANDYNPGGSTNWEDGFRVARYQLPRPSTVQPHLVVFITDGNPNRIINERRVTYDPGNPSPTANEYENKVPLADREVTNAGNDTSANRAVSNSNTMKVEGSHVLALAVGDGLSGQGTLSRLRRVSGDDVFGGGSGSTQPEFDISTTDVYRETDFSKLEEALREAAFQLCAPSITVRKLVDLTPDTDVSDAVAGPGFDLTAVPTPTPSRWVLPAGATGTTATTTTDGNGFASFQWDTVTPTSSDVTITEEDPSGVIPGLVYRPDLTRCTFRTPDQPADAPLATSPVALGFEATIPQNAIVTCDIYNVLPPDPSVDIEKSTDGFDADAAPGPSIAVGDTVRWEYVVTNTGNVSLDPVVVTDVPAQSIACPDTSLAPGASTTCTASGVATAGQYMNTATVTGTPPSGPDVSDTDPSHYLGANPGVSIEKATNGVDADTAPGPYVEVGDPVTWSYVVSNTGGVDLAGITASDDLEGAITCPSTTLAVGGSMTCTPIVLGGAVAGPYENLATVTGTAGAVTVGDSDPSHYFGASPDVDLEKFTNLEDADTPTGPVVESGSGVLWIYAVENTGNVPLTSINVVDTVVAPIGSPAPTVECPQIGALLPGDFLYCVAVGTAIDGQYANDATVTAEDPNSVEVTASDPSHYIGITPAINVEKSTNGVDADVAPGPFLAPGGAITWTYRVQNTGNVDLSNVSVTDSVEGPISCPTAALAPGEVTTCTAAGTATEGQYTNTATATGTDVLDTQVTDSDPSHYFGAVPGIDVEKSTNGLDADDPEDPDGELNGPFLLVGDEVTWSYRVTNTGNETVAQIALSDDQLGTISCPSTTLGPGESMDCSEPTGTAVAGLYANVATVRANPVQGGSTVTDTDPSHYYGYEPGIDIEKSTNGVDADTPTGPSIPVGDPVEWEYVVTNIGNIAIVSFDVTDSDPAVQVTCPPPAPLDPGASVTCTAPGVAQGGQYQNTATVEGVDFFEDVVTDSDPSHYIGETPTVPTTIPPTTNPPTSTNPPTPTTSVPSGELPATGSNGTGSVLRVGLATALLGLGALLLARRRTRSA